MYGGLPYAGGPYAGALVSEADIPTDGNIYTAVEVAFTTTPLDPSPAFVDIGGDCRWWDTVRGRSGELERFQPGRATVVLDNRDRQYDSHNDAGPWYGHLKPNKRIRIRETVNGVTYDQYDGYVDSWKLDYPDVGHDATATVTATDLFKILARTELPLSVYHDVVIEDEPEVYWRFDEQKNWSSDAALTAKNWGTLGSTADATYVGPPELGWERLVVNDPGTSMMIESSATRAGTGDMGARVEAAAFSLTPAAGAGFVVEFWCIPQAAPGANATLMTQRHAAGTDVHIYYTLSNTFVINTFPAAGSPTATTSPTTYPPHGRYHVVAKVIPGESVKLWVNGTLHDQGQIAAGTWDTPGPLVVGYLPGSPSLNWVGMISHVAVWRGAAAAAFGATEVAEHYAAGTHPWQGDTGDVRLGRVLDKADVPTAMRSFDAGEVTLQSAELENQTALEHALKVGETEFPQIWVTRDGRLRFMNKTTLLGRLPDVTFGDEAGEAGYRDLAYDEGDGAIRNDVAVSRLQGVSKTSLDAASIDEYGRLSFVREGLLHDSEAYSQAYADLIRLEYAEPRRRIARLDLGAPVVGEEAGGWPALLGVELQQAVTVVHQPLGGGDRFEQVCAIEGIRHTSRPGEERTASLTLSPEYTS